MLVERASPTGVSEYEKAGVPLREIGGPTSTSMLYWLALPAYLRRDRTAVAQAAGRSAALVSSFFPMHWAASAAARERTGIRHVHLCFEPFPFFHDREVIGMYPPWKRALLAYLRTAYGGSTRRGVAGADRAAHAEPGHRRLDRARVRHQPARSPPTPASTRSSSTPTPRPSWPTCARATATGRS